MRIWHLIDAASPQATATTLGLLGASLGRLGHIHQHVVLLGAAPLRDSAQVVGIRQATVVGVPFGHAPFGYFALRRYAKTVAPPDVVHCWSIGTLSLATLLFRRCVKLLTMTVMPTTRQSQWLRVITGEAGLRTALLPISSTIRHVLLGRGVSPETVHVLRPGLDMGWVAHGSRDALRAAWGVDWRRTKVVALLADPPWTADAMAAVMAVSLADEVQQPGRSRVCLLVHPDSLHRRRAVDAMENLGHPDRLVVDDRLDQPWLVLPGCDMAVAQGSGGGGLGLLWAMAANVPILGEALHAISEIVEDRHSALLAKPGQPKALAHRICQLLADPQLAWRLRDTARSEAYSFFSRQRYCQSLKLVYEQAIQDKPLQVPAP